MANKSGPFEGAGGQVGVEVWRIEQLRPVRVPKEAHSAFFTGDSYLVLHSKPAGAEELSYDLHFWLGEATSQDESGAAAIFATELDEHLGGKAKQFRQVQGGESPEFAELFDGSLQYRAGGVKSGFRHMEPDKPPPPALLRVKGKKVARVQEVPLDVESLSNDDIFILDLHSKLVLWSGSEANVQEKARAREVLAAMKAGRSGQPEIVVIEEGESDDAAAGFFATLGAEDPAKVKVRSSTSSDEAADAQAASSQPRLYEVVHGSDGPAAKEIEERPLLQSLLKPSLSYVLAADGWLFFWQGRDAVAAGKKGRKGGLALARQMLTELGLPPHTPVQLVKEGAEDTAFTQHFEGLRPATPVASAERESGLSRAAEPSSPAGKAVTAVAPPRESPAPARPTVQPPVSPRADAPSPAPQPPTPTPASTGFASAPPTLAKTPSTPATSSAAAASPRSLGSPSPADKTNGPAAESTKNASADSPASAAAKTSELEPRVKGPQPTDVEKRSAPEAAQSATAARGTPRAVDGSMSPKSGEQKRSKALSKTPAKPPPTQKEAEFVPRPRVSEPVAETKPPEGLKFTPKQDVLAYEQLKDMKADSGIDMTRKEDYLSAEEFEKVFGKSQAAFAAQPKWRQLQAKKQVGLF